MKALCGKNVVDRPNTIWFDYKYCPHCMFQAMHIESGTIHIKTGRNGIRHMGHSNTVEVTDYAFEEQSRN